MILVLALYGCLGGRWLPVLGWWFTAGFRVFAVQLVGLVVGCFGFGGFVMVAVWFVFWVVC